MTPTDMGRSEPQFGGLISLNYEQVCLRNEKGLVMHCPRMGYEVVSASEEGKFSTDGMRIVCDRHFDRCTTHRLRKFQI